MLSKCTAEELACPHRPDRRPRLVRSATPAGAHLQQDEVCQRRAHVLVVKEWLARLGTPKPCLRSCGIRLRTGHSRCWRGCASRQRRACARSGGQRAIGMQGAARAGSSSGRCRGCHRAHQEHKPASRAHSMAAAYVLVRQR